MKLKHLFISVSLGLIPFSAHAIMGAADKPEEQAPIEPGQEPLIRMNKEDPTYNVWKKIREDLNEGREPGPINIQRFYGGLPWQGMPTFFHLPVALTKEDLEAGEVEVAIFGAELFNGMRVQSYGPMEMRAPMKSDVYHNWGAYRMPELNSGLTVLDELAVVDYGDAPMKSDVYHNWGAFRMPELNSGLTVLDELTVVDYGDAPIHPLSMEQSIPEVRKMVAEVASVKLENGKRTIPIIIGGGHALMYPDAAGLTDVYGKGNVQIIHFDAHADQAPVGFGVFNTHGNPVRQLVEDGLIKGEDIIQIGLRGPNSSDMDGVAWNRSSGLRYHMMAEVERRGWQDVMDEVLAEAKANGKPLFLSFDIDVVDPAFIPGTSTPEPGGMYMREALPLVRRICAENNLVGMEIVELRPERDPGYISVQNSKAILRACLNGIAMNKKGLPENYLHPDIVDDGK